MSQEIQKSPNGTNGVAEQHLESMEALLKQSTQGIHVLFENSEIAKALSKAGDNREFFDFAKMKRVQDVMTHLVSKKNYIEKLAYLRDLDPESYHLLIRTYFHIVENAIRQASDRKH